MRAIAVLVLLLSANATATAQDFEIALRAYEKADYGAALEGFERAAYSGDADAQFMLGRIHAGGLGTLQDFVSAYKWYVLAAAQSQRFAAPVRDALAERMTPAQIAEAQAQAAQFQPGREAPVELSARSEAMAQPADEEPSETLIAQVQLNLKRLGYAVGVIDGQMNEIFELAVRDYQNDNQLSADGRVSEQLLNHLNGSRPEQPTIQPGAPVQIIPNDDRAPVTWRKLL